MTERDIKQRIIALRQAFMEKYGKAPTKVYFTPSTPWEIAALGAEHLGHHLVGAIAELGPGVALKQRGNQFLGMQIVWDHTGVGVADDKALFEHDLKG